MTHQSNAATRARAPLHLTSSDQCEIGRRSSNDDCLLIDAEVGLYAVFDGAGARLGGRTAAELACKVVRERAAETAVEEELQATLVHAHQRIRKAQSEDVNLAQMTTTAALLRNRGSHALLAHVGDSRIYLQRDGALSQLTRDHSLENYAQDHPSFRPKRRMPGKALVRALGQTKRDTVTAEIQRIELLHDDLLLLCSDGLTDSVPHWTLQQILAGAQCYTLEELSHCLVRAALSHGSVDNISLILLRASDRPAGGGGEPRTELFEVARHQHARAPVGLGWLAFLEGPRRGNVVPIDATVVVGADPDCRIVINDGYVSGRHTEVFRTAHGFTLRDLGSTNGTFVNNVRVSSGEASLVDGDVVRVGKTEMVFKGHRITS